KPNGDWTQIGQERQINRTVQRLLDGPFFDRAPIWNWKKKVPYLKFCCWAYRSPLFWNQSQLPSGEQDFPSITSREGRGFSFSHSPKDFSKTCKKAWVSCAPDTPYCRLITKNGTPRTPTCRAS